MPTKTTDLVIYNRLLAVTRLKAGNVFLKAGNV